MACVGPKRPTTGLSLAKNVVALCTVGEMLMSLSTDAALRLPARLSGVIFDCDGVLIDSRAANAEYYNRVLAAFGLPPLTEEQEAYTFMATAEQALRYIVPPSLHPRLPEVCRTAVDYFRDILPLIRLEEGLPEFLKFLRGHGLRCAVHTNRAGGMTAVLDRFRLKGQFNPVVTVRMVAPKPAPDGIFYVQQCWGARTDELLFIGDSDNDARTAAAAGVAFAAFRNPSLDAAVKVDSFKELATLLCAGPVGGSPSSGEYLFA